MRDGKQIALNQGQDSQDCNMLVFAIKSQGSSGKPLFIKKISIRNGICLMISEEDSLCAEAAEVVPSLSRLRNLKSFSAGPPLRSGSFPWLGP